MEGGREKGREEYGRVLASVRGWGIGGFAEESERLLLTFFRYASVIYWCLGA